MMSDVKMKDSATLPAQIRVQTVQSFAILNASECVGKCELDFHSA